MHILLPEIREINLIELDGTSPAMALAYSLIGTPSMPSNRIT